ncbi:hypothetical protein [Enterobacter sp. R4-368]|uniref:hypothetical protein n=1 Tax=Enterobacter sp. R4-368 TaxID=1166130 RepID=UPI0003A51D8F|nr:hypothetical protein [Enterobacter sp. R4-368]
MKNGGYEYGVKAGTDRQYRNCGIIILPAGSVYAAPSQALSKGQAADALHKASTAKTAIDNGGCILVAAQF